MCDVAGEGTGQTDMRQVSSANDCTASPRCLWYRGNLYFWGPGAPRSVIKTLAWRMSCLGRGHLFGPPSELGGRYCWEALTLNCFPGNRESLWSTGHMVRLGNIGARVCPETFRGLCMNQQREELLTHCCPDGSLLRKSMKEAPMWHVFSRVSLRVLPPWKWRRDFPGGPVVKTASSQFKGPRFNPWSGN